jgi:ADP-heptose:LPS heptosyltransferase
VPLGGLEPPLMPDLATAAEAFRREVGGRPLATVQTGAGEADKAYPHWLDVAAALQGRGWSVVGIGGPGDPRLPSPTIDLVGRLDLRGAMATVLASDVHLAADTGTGHVAAAYGVPVVSVFSKNEPERFRPYSSAAAVLREGRSAASVDPDQVVEAAVRLVEARGPVLG